MIKNLAEEEKSTTFNRRRFIAATGMAVAGSALVGKVALAELAPKMEVPTPEPVSAPALPWPWKKLDPMEAGTRAFNYYHEKGG